MRVILDSVHSQVPETIAKLDRRFDIVVSLDSHLDVSLGGDDLLYPRELHVIAARTGAHTKIAEVTHAPVIVAIPEEMMVAHASDIESKLPSDLRIPGSAESVASVVDFLYRERGISIFQSPPRSLLELVPKLKGRPWLLDIDVDYMQEMQDECYTRIVDAQPGVLQPIERVIEFVRSTRPEVITVSEAKLSAVRAEGSSISKLLKSFRNMGCQVEEDSLLDDASVIRGISVCNEFYSTVSTVLMRKHVGEMMEGDFQGFKRDEKAAARDFFARNGYVSRFVKAPAK